MTGWTQSQILWYAFERHTFERHLLSQELLTCDFYQVKDLAARMWDHRNAALRILEALRLRDYK